MDFMFDADTYAMSSDAESGNGKNAGSPKQNGLPSFQIQSDLSKRLSSLSIIQSINKGLGRKKAQIQNTEGVSASNPEPTSSQAMEYARSSLSLLEGSSEEVASKNMINQMKSKSTRGLDSDILKSRVDRVLSQTGYDFSLRQSISLLEERINGKNGALSPENDQDSLHQEDLVQPGPSGTINRRKLRGKVEEDMLRRHFLMLHAFSRLQGSSST